MKFGNIDFGGIHDEPRSLKLVDYGVVYLDRSTIANFTFSLFYHCLYTLHKHNLLLRALLKLAHLSRMWFTAIRLFFLHVFMNGMTYDLNMNFIRAWFPTYALAIQNMNLFLKMHLRKGETAE